MAIPLVLVSLALEQLAEAPTSRGPGAAALLDAGANDPFFTLKLGQVWRWVTAVFLHSGPPHLLTNLLWLGLLVALTARLGIASPREAITLALLTAVLGQLVSSLASPGSSVGASGGAYGLVGLAFWRGGVSPRRALQPWQRWCLLVIGILSVVGTFAKHESPAVDHAAHLAGFAAGVALAATSIGASRRHQALAIAIITVAWIAHGVSSLTAGAYPAAVSPALSAAGLLLPEVGISGWLDAAGHCRPSDPPHDTATAVQCRLVPTRVAALAGPVTKLLEAQPQLAEHMPKRTGCVATHGEVGPGAEQMLLIRRGNAAVVLMARRSHWQRLGALRARLRRDRCPDNQSPPL